MSARMISRSTIVSRRLQRGIQTASEMHGPRPHPAPSCFILDHSSRQHASQLYHSSRSYHSSTRHLYRLLPPAWHHPNFLPGASALDKEVWLQSQLHEHQSQLDAHAFRIVLQALVDSDLPDAALRAERWLVLLERLAVHHPKLTPTSDCYTFVLQSWAKATTEDAGLAVTRATRWLHSPHLNTAGANAVLDLCSKGRALKLKGGRALAKEHSDLARDLLERMIRDRQEHGRHSQLEPTIESFNFVLRGYTRSRKDPTIADQAMGLLSRLEEYQRTVDPTVKPNLQTYAMVMDAISVRAKQLVQKHLNHSHLWKDPTCNGLHQLQLLNKILAFLQTTHDCQPTTAIYNVVLATWANLSSPLHPNAPLQAERLLQSLDAPDDTSYRMVLRAYKNSNRRHRGARAYWWLQQQWRHHERHGNRQPTTATYNVVLQVWASLGDPKQAEKVLQELIKYGQYHDTLQPNTESYSAVIKAWLVVAHKGSWEALAAAARWIQSVAPCDNDSATIVSSVDWYSDWMSAARKVSPQHPEALDLAINVLEQLEASHHTVDCLHYSRLLQTGLWALSREQDSSRRNEFIQSIVTKCMEQGLVSRPLIRALSNGPVFYDGWTIEESMRTMDESFPDWPLPASWTRNIRQDGFLPKRGDFVRRNFYLSHHGCNDERREDGNNQTMSAS